MPRTGATDTPSPLHRIGRNLRNPFALGYLALCLALLVWALVVTIADDSGESMAGVIPLLATAPTSLVFLSPPGAPRPSSFPWPSAPWSTRASSAGAPAR